MGVERKIADTPAVMARSPKRAAARHAIVKQAPRFNFVPPVALYQTLKKPNPRTDVWQDLVDPANSRLRDSRLISNHRVQPMHLPFRTSIQKGLDSDSFDSYLLLIGLLSAVLLVAYTITAGT